MIVVIPFSADADYTAALTEAMFKHGGLGLQRLLVVAPTSLDGPAAVFHDKLGPAFHASEIKYVQVPESNVTRLFRDGLCRASSVKLSQQEPPAPPILWLERGWLPAARDWATVLGNEFYSQGAIPLASWEQLPAQQIRSGGRMIELPSGVAPLGPVVFPFQFYRSSATVSQINNRSPFWKSMLQYEFLRYKNNNFTDAALKLFEKFGAGSVSTGSVNRDEGPKAAHDASLDVAQVPEQEPPPRKKGRPVRNRFVGLQMPSSSLGVGASISGEAAQPESDQ